MKIEAVFLDFDGVILDSWSVAINLIKHFANEFGCPISEADEEKIRKNWGHRGNKIFKLVFSDKDENFRQEFYQKWIEKEKEILESEIARQKNMPIIKGAIETIDYLKKKEVICGLITNRSANLFPKSEEMDEILQKLDFIQTVDTEENKLHKNHLISRFLKPDPKAFDPAIKFVAERGIKTKKIVFVEDSLISIKPIKRRGIKFLGVCSGPIDTVKKWQKWGRINPKNVLNSIADLPEWLEKQRQK